mgnify:CR=1 FL=1
MCVMTTPTMAPWNLGLRFGLELAALAGFGIAAWRLTDGVWRWPAVIGVPLAAAVVWGVFNVPGDPSRSGEAPIAVPGAVRLAIELTTLGGGAAAFILSGPRPVGITLAVTVVFHYAMSIDRIDWLLGRRRSGPAQTANRL